MSLTIQETTEAKSECIIVTLETGQLVEVRRRQWVVAEVQASEPDGGLGAPQHCLTLSSIDEDALGEQTELDKPIKGDGWATSPAERMVELCRANDVRLGLVTNGEQWMLIDAPVGAVTTFASWYARLWGPEPTTLQAFVNLLGIRRFFVDPSEQLAALLDESLKLQDEVTDALGEQVRRAVEVLIQALDRADVDRNRELLEGVEPPEIYEASLTIMMRIVLPPGFGEWNSVFMRFRRWAQGGVFQRVFEAVSGDPDFECVPIDGAIVSVHQKASGVKGGLKIKPSVDRRVD